MVTCLNLEVNTSHGNMSDLSVFWPFLRTKQKKICRYLSLPQRAPSTPPKCDWLKKVIMQTRLTKLVLANINGKYVNSNLKVDTSHGNTSNLKVDTSQSVFLEVLL